MNYSIIIPVFNEENCLPVLLKQLYPFSKNNEIVFIDDGSDDNSYKILQKIDYIKLVKLSKNFGKGVAIQSGIKKSKFSKIIIYDADLELDTNNIIKLMRLNKKLGVNSLLGFRLKEIDTLNFSYEWGNFIFTLFFNLINMTSYRDVLCCAKSFYKDEVPLNKLKSKGFDIDIEIICLLTKNNKRKQIPQVSLKYKRRSLQEGKKLRIIDGWVILKRIILNFYS
jgi:glycosyltransferase involved in cell wall biosynthesis